LCDASCEQEKEPGNGTVRAWSSFFSAEGLDDM